MLLNPLPTHLFLFLAIAEAGDIETYDGVLDDGTRQTQVFRIQEGAVAKFICPMANQGQLDKLNDDHFEMGWKIGVEGPWSVDNAEYFYNVDIEEKTRYLQAFGFGFRKGTGKRVSTMTYVARREDNRKWIQCRLHDMDLFDSVAVHENLGSNPDLDEGALTLLVLRKYKIMFRTCVVHIIITQ